MSLTITIGMIVILFAILTTIKSFTRKKFCAICSSVTLTWIFLLVTYNTGIFSDQLIIGILIGQTIHGVYTILTKKEKMKIYSLPILLTLTTIGYTIITKNIQNILITLTILMTMWAFALLLNAHIYNPKIKKIVEKILRCCKNW